MKKQVSFKKELMFKTKLCEITSISLEHHILKKEDEIISGEFIINGEYKMTEGSINREKYEFNLPFDIALNSKYDIDSVKVDIDDFYYEIVNNEKLNINIELLIEALEKKEIKERVKEKDDVVLEYEKYEKEKVNNSLSETRDIANVNDNINTNVNTNTNKIIDNTNVINSSDDNLLMDNASIGSNLFITEEETYKAYYVYIVKEEDTIDSILDKYGISKEDFEMYNKIEDVKPSNKVIIPYECK